MIALTESEDGASDSIQFVTKSKPEMTWNSMFWKIETHEFSFHFLKNKDLSKLF